MMLAFEKSTLCTVRKQEDKSQLVIVCILVDFVQVADDYQNCDYFIGADHRSVISSGVFDEMFKIYLVKHVGIVKRW